MKEDVGTSKPKTYMNHEVNVGPEKNSGNKNNKKHSIKMKDVGTSKPKTI